MTKQHSASTVDPIAVRHMAEGRFDHFYGVDFRLSEAAKWVAAENRPALTQPWRGQGRGQDVRIGIVGLNRGRSFVEWCRQVPHAKVEAVCDLSTDLARAMAETLNVPKWFDRAEALFDDEAIDLVLIVTGPPSQAPLAKKALAAGKHVMCEVPGYLKLDDCHELLERSESQGLLATTFNQYPFFVHLETVKDLVEQGQFGRVFHADTEYMFNYSMGRLEGYNRWKYQEDKAAALGTPANRGYGVRYESLASGGVGAIESVLWCLGHERLKSVTAMSAGCLEPDSRHDHNDAMVALFESETGRIVKLSVGHSYRIPHRNYFALYGTDGSYEGNRLEQLRAGYVHLPGIFRKNPIHTAEEAWIPLPTRGRMYEYIAPETLCVADAVEAIRTGRRPVVDARISAHLAACLISAEEAAATRKPVTIPLFR
jgi:predicted dehydrogenase